MFDDDSDPNLRVFFVMCMCVDACCKWLIVIMTFYIIHFVTFHLCAKLLIACVNTSVFLNLRNGVLIQTFQVISLRFENEYLFVLSLKFRPFASVSETIARLEILCKSFVYTKLGG